EARADDVRAVVVTGAGRGFCVGQDLTEFRESAGDIAHRLRGTYHPTILGLRSLEKPVVAAVNGAAAGAGLSLALACDLRLAANSATFVPAFINIGLVPDSGCSYFAARLLGYARALEWLTSGRRLTAAEAHTWGLVSEVVEADRLAARAAERAAELAALPTRGIALTKRLLDHAQAEMPKVITEANQAKPSVIELFGTRLPSIEYRVMSIGLIAIPATSASGAISHRECAASSGSEPRPSTRPIQSSRCTTSTFHVMPP